MENKKILTWIDDRIEAIFHCPDMWAISNEALILQILLLIEMKLICNNIIVRVPDLFQKSLYAKYGETNAPLFQIEIDREKIIIHLKEFSEKINTIQFGLKELF